MPIAAFRPLFEAPLANKRQLTRLLEEKAGQPEHHRTPLAGQVSKE